MPWGGFVRKDFRTQKPEANDKVTAKALLLGIILSYFNRHLFAQGEIRLAGVILHDKRYYHHYAKDDIKNSHHNHTRRYFERPVDFSKFLKTDAEDKKVREEKESNRIDKKSENHFTRLAKNQQDCVAFVEEMTKALTIFPNLVALLSVSDELARAAEQNKTLEQIVRSKEHRGNGKFLRWNEIGKISFSVTPHIIPAALIDQRQAMIDERNLFDIPKEKQDEHLAKYKPWLYYHEKPLNNPTPLSNGFKEERHPLNRKADVIAHVRLAKEECRQVYGQKHMRWIWNAEANMDSTYAKILSDEGIRLGFVGFKKDGNGDSGHFAYIKNLNKLPYLRPTQPVVYDKVILCPYSAHSDSPWGQKYLDWQGGAYREVNDFTPWNELLSSPKFYKLDEHEAPKSNADFLAAARETPYGDGLSQAWRVASEFTDGENAVQNYGTGGLIWLYKLIALQRLSGRRPRIATADEIINTFEQKRKANQKILFEIKKLPFGTWSHTNQLWIAGNETQWWLYYYLSRLIYDLESKGATYLNPRTRALWEDGIFRAEVSCYPWHLYPGGALMQGPQGYTTEFFEHLAWVYQQAKKLGYNISPFIIPDDKISDWVGPATNDTHRYFGPRELVRIANEKFKPLARAASSSSAAAALNQAQKRQSLSSFLPSGLIYVEREHNGKKEIEIENQSAYPSGDIYLTIEGRKIVLNLAPGKRKVLTFWQVPAAYREFSTYQLFEKVRKIPENKKAFDAFWLRASIEGTPLLSANKKEVIFIYRGDAEKVFLTGDMTGWDEARKIPLKRLGATDLFYVKRAFKSDGLFDYKFIADGNYICDFTNLRVASGRFGDNSLLVMPDFKEAEEFKSNPSLIQKGKLREHVIPSKYLGFDYKVMVYRPYDYSHSKHKSYPVVFFEDGMDYIRLAKAPAILDNLIVAKKIPPVIAVFVIAPGEAAESRIWRQSISRKYTQFFTSELLPRIQEEYRISNDPRQRLIIGNVFGGLLALHIGLEHPALFAKVAAQTGYISFANDALIKKFAARPHKDISLYLGVGSYETDVTGLSTKLTQRERNFLRANRDLRKVLSGKGYQVFYKEFTGGYSWSHWSNELPFILTNLLTTSETEAPVARSSSSAIVDISKIELPLERNLPVKNLLVAGGLSNVMTEFYREKLRALAKRYNILLHAIDIVSEPQARERIKHENLPFESYSRDYPQRRFDGLLVLTWPNSHFDFIERAAQDNIPVFVEKPIVLPQDLSRTHSLAKNKNNIFAIDYFFDSPAILEAAQFINQGHLGKIKKIEGALLWNYPVEHGRGWLLERRKSGGGYAMDLMTHLIAGIEQLLENQNASFKDFKFAPNKVIFSRYEGAPIGGETYAAVSGDIKGLGVDMRVGKGTGSDMHTITIKGDRGQLKIDIGDKLARPELEFIPVSGPAWRKVYRETDIGYYSLVRKIFDSLQGLGNVTQRERDFRLRTTMLAVRVVDRLQKAFSGNYFSYPFSRELSRFIHKKEGGNRNAKRANSSSAAVISAQAQNKYEYISPIFTGNHIMGGYLPLFSVKSKTGQGIGNIEHLYKMSELYQALGWNALQVAPMNLCSMGMPYSLKSTRLMDWGYASLDLLLGRSSYSGHDEFYQELKNANIGVKQAEEYLQAHRGEIDLLRDAKVTDHSKVRVHVKEALKHVWQEFNKLPQINPVRKSFEQYKQKNPWLSDHILFVLMEEKFATGYKWLTGWDFRNWYPELSKYPQYRQTHIASLKRKLSKEIEIHSFMQYVFFRQWQSFLKFSHQHNVGILGDMPWAADGADIWIHQDMFGVAKGKKRRYTHALPPDSLHPCGQYYQFNLYDWKDHRTLDYFINRFKYLTQYYDYLRLDFARGAYRLYRFFEDPQDKLTLEKLGIMKSDGSFNDESFARRLERAQMLNASNPDNFREQLEVAKELYWIIVKALHRSEALTAEDKAYFFRGYNKNIFDGYKRGLTQDSTIYVARPSQINGTHFKADTHTNGWERIKYVVERGMTAWDLLPLPQSNTELNVGGQTIKTRREFEFLRKYLFPDDSMHGPQGSDGLRIGYFTKSPGERLVSELLNVSQQSGKVLITELLGMMPPQKLDSIHSLAGVMNYAPGIFLDPVKNEWVKRKQIYRPWSMATYSTHDTINLEGGKATGLAKGIRDEGLTAIARARGKDIKALRDVVLSDGERHALLNPIVAAPSLLSVLMWVDWGNWPGSWVERITNISGTTADNWVCKMPIAL
ncbi:MAG: 4-alpha-glucanotransferase, partial [Candidatus Omnitrophica bacterium]|nr:4-alpha-glucanotransferase [Candidatus Omnitrophota bacterium]